LKQAPASETVLILVSTAYLKAKWTTPFDAFETAPRPFTTGKGTPVQAPTMKQLGQYALGKGDGWQAVALPYQGDRLRMVAVVPDDLGAFESKLGPALLEQVRASLRAAPRSIELTMPKFTFRTDAQLNATLQALGAKTMFDERAADLSGITGPGGPPLVVSAVLQQTWLQVDEEGTEAAAATAGIVRATAAHIAPESFHVDRPFLFFVEDQPTGAVLFLGRVVDPTAP
jgi:serpin B